MTRILKQYGYTFLRHCRGSHEFWANGDRRILVTRSGLNDTRARQNWMNKLRRIAA